MAEDRIGKDRLLEMYARLAEGKVLYKLEEAEHYKCSLRSIQRDIEDLRAFFHNQSDASGVVQELVYDKKHNAYKLVPPLRNVLSNKEVFAVLKILLESRSLSKSELDPILDKLIDCCVPKECKSYVNGLISNERFHYVPPRHNKEVLETMWRLGEALREHKQVEIDYRKPADGSLVHRVLRPAGVMFSEFYFYLAGFIVPQKEEKIEFEVENDPFPTIYRIDRIESLKVTDRHYNVPYESRFEEGEFRKRVQFMYGGRLQKLKFYYKGPNPEPVLDRLPTAEIIDHNEKGYLLTAEVFGSGIDIWLRSQGELVEVVQ